MKVLVVSGTGTVGSRVVQRLKKHHGVETVVASRTPSAPGQVLFDWSRPSTWVEALRGCEKAVLITPASPTEGADGVKFVERAREVGVRHVVFLSIHDVAKAPSIPHFASKISIQTALEQSGMRWTSVAANNFYQNDHWFKTAMLEYGVYPQPFGPIGLSRVDVEDIADAIVNAILDETLAGQTYPLVGPQVWTSSETARMYGRALGKNIAYAGDDLEAWSHQAKQSLPEWLVDDWREMYAFFQREGLRASAEDLLRQSKILKRAPRSFESFVQETVRQWKEN